MFGLGAPKRSGGPNNVVSGVLKAKLYVVCPDLEVAAGSDFARSLEFAAVVENAPGIAWYSC